ncbi:MAG: hypothetical protein AAGC79_06890 [Pseudomonadota bacterium]
MSGTSIGYILLTVGFVMVLGAGSVMYKAMDHLDPSIISQDPANRFNLVIEEPQGLFARRD